MPIRFKLRFSDIRGRGPGSSTTSEAALPLTETTSSRKSPAAQSSQPIWSSISSNSLRDGAAQKLRAAELRAEMLLLRSAVGNEWHRRYEELQLFVKTNGHYPRANVTRRNKAQYTPYKGAQ